MKFEEIHTSILNTTNSYEESRSIKTLNVECVIKKENSALFIADKSDNTRTIFYARKTKRGLDDTWSWFCPSEEELRDMLPLLNKIYFMINEKNDDMRKFVQ